MKGRLCDRTGVCVCVCVCVGGGVALLFFLSNFS